MTFGKFFFYKVGWKSSKKLVKNKMFLLKHFKVIQSSTETVKYRWQITLNFLALRKHITHGVDVTNYKTFYFLNDLKL